MFGVWARADGVDLVEVVRAGDGGALLPWACVGDGVCCVQLVGRVEGAWAEAWWGRGACPKRMGEKVGEYCGVCAGVCDLFRPHEFSFSDPRHHCCNNCRTEGFR